MFGYRVDLSVIMDHFPLTWTYITICRCLTRSCSSDHSCRTCLIIPGVFLYIFVGSPRINRIEFTIPSTVAIKYKGIMNITAHIIAFPKPEMYWQLRQNGSYLNVSKGITNSFNINRQSSNLVKSNLTEADFGTYSVYAYNGVQNTHYLLHSVIVVPASKYIIHILRLLTCMRTFTCTGIYTYTYKLNDREVYATRTHTSTILRIFLQI